MESRRGLVLLRSKVARRLLWSFLLCAGAPILALAVLTFADVSRGLREQSEERLREAAKSSGLLLLDRLVAIRGFFQAAARASDPELWRASSTPLPPGAEEILDAATLRRADGALVALLGAPVPAIAIAPSDHQRGRIVLRRGASGPVLVFAIPLDGEASEPLLLAEIDAGRLVRDVLATALPPHVEYCVMAHAGLVLACSRDELAPLLPALGDGHAGSFETESGDVAYFGAHWTLFLDSQIEAGSWSILVFEPKASALGALARFRVLFPLLALACFGLVFLASVGRIRRQMEPLDRLQEATRQVGEGRFDVAVPAGGGDEFGALADSFNAMAGQLARQFGLLARLIELDREILSASDERNVAGALIEGLHGVHPCAAVGVLLCEPDRAGRLSGWLGWTGERRRMSLDVELPAPAQARLCSGGVVDLELGGEPAQFLAPIAAAGFARARVLPLEAAAGLVGLIVLADPGADGAAPPDPAVARQVADQAAVAIVNARTAERNRFLAQRDALTGLANRQIFHDRLEQAIAGAGRGDQLVAVCLIDLDRFKAVNDGLGHAAGDRLLQQVAARLRGQARSGSLARMGGDEFTLLLPGVASPEACSSIVQRMLEAISAPFDLDGREIFVTASAGVALYPIDGAGGEDLLKHADTAMYEAKRQGGDRLAFYTHSLSERASKRIALESALRRAVERDEIVPLYQPLADVTSREWVGFEVLARWTSP
ncbi:MAG TPA: diguanylate cyclase, partial [Myxococcota bacterium]|nr:diguanylate cyclase [Myxococcota bacterium]